MKKLLCIILSVLMMVSVVSLVSCKKTEKTLKFGMGVAVSTSATSATKEKNGTGEVDSTVAVITVDADGKVVACKIDVAQIEASYDKDGKAVATTDFRTKGEKKFDYNMVNYQASTKEWFEQAAAFEGVVVGKTRSEIKALVAEDGKGVKAVETAGCTITVSDFVKAIEKAFENLADSKATASSTLKIGMATDQTLTDYNAETKKDGTNEIDTTIFGAAVNADGKIIAVDTDCTQVRFTFNAAGESTFTDTEVPTKRQRGAAYGMKGSEIWGTDKVVEKEWFEQADAFESLCIGKTATEIAGLAASDGKGTDTVKDAGCTITVSGFTAAAAKIAK